MNNLPSYIYLIFGITVLLAIYIYFKASNNSKSFLIIVFCWIIFQTIMSVTGFYKIVNTIPPRFALLIIPPIISIIILFCTKKGQYFINNYNIKTLTIFHIIRIPIELILYWLFISKTVPGLMTFEGRNFDIFSGISAPLIFYFGFVKKKISRSIIIIWNLICLALLINIVFNAILSLPGEFQQFAFDQPNIAILQFPFLLLPSVLVPLVFFSHLATIRHFYYHSKDWDDI